MLRTDCKLDQFVPCWPAFQLYKVVLFKNWTRPNGLKAGLIGWKLAEWFTRILNGLEAVQACQTIYAFKSGRPAYNPVERLKIRSKV